MASLYLFCSLEELDDWVSAMCEKWKLGCLLFRASDRFGRWEPDYSKLRITGDVWRIFALPLSDAPTEELIVNDVRPRDWGWIDIRLGGLLVQQEQSILLGSEIHGEDFEGEDVHPARFVQWLKRHLKKKSLLQEGVVGRNLVTGGSAKYRHIEFSRTALDLFNSGCIWKQHPKDNVVFEPAER